jgi:CRP-like cAMP-binding protein
MLRLHQDLSPEFIADLGTRIRRIEAKKGYTLHLKGDICDHLWLIENGMLACYDHDADGKRRYCSWLMRTGDFVTAVDSFNNQVVSTETIIAIKACILWAITKKDLDELTGKYPEFRNIRQHLTDYYHVQSRVMDTKRKRPPEQYYDYLRSAFPEIVEEAPSAVLASLMGISRSKFYALVKQQSKKR